MTNQQKPKNKGGSIGRGVFLMLWVNIYIGVFLMAIGVTVISSQFNIAGVLPVLLQLAIIGGGSMVGQKYLIQLYTGRNVDGWIKSGVYGWVLGAVLSTLLAVGLISPLINGPSDTAPLWRWMLVYLPALGMPGVLHALRLRKHVDNAWLYGLGSLVGSVLVPLFIIGNTASLLHYAGALASFALTTGLTLIWLFGMSGGAQLMTDEQTSTQHTDATARLSDNNTSDQDEAPYSPPQKDDDAQQRNSRHRWNTWWRSWRKQFAGLLH